MSHYCCKRCGQRYDDCRCPPLPSTDASLFKGLIRPAAPIEPPKRKYLENAKPKRTSLLRPKKESRADRLPVRPNKWGLTRTEAYVMDLMVQGMSATMIAEHMCLSVKTVATYSGRARERMGAVSPHHALLMWDREYYVRPLALDPLTVLRCMLNREPNEEEKRINFNNWEHNPKVYEALLEHARTKLQSETGSLEPLMFHRLQYWFNGTGLQKEQWESLLAAIRGDAV